MGIIILLFIGGIAFARIKNLPLDDMSNRQMGAVLGNNEACIMIGNREADKLLYLYLIDREETRNMGIFTPGHLLPSPDDRYVAHSEGIFDIKGDRIISAFPRWFFLEFSFSNWSPDSAYLAVNQLTMNRGYMLRFASVERPK